MFLSKLNDADDDDDEIATGIALQRAAYLITNQSWTWVHCCWSNPIHKYLVLNRTRI